MKKAVLYFDGGTAISNPGKAGCAAVLKLEGGEVLKFNKALGYQTNNVAEWEGLLLGLSEALRMQVTDIEVFGDSNLVINQAASRWTAKADNMKAMQARCFILTRQFNKTSFTWIPRLQNSEADACCNEVIRQHYKLEPFDTEAAKEKKKERKQKLALTQQQQTLTPQSQFDSDPKALIASLQEQVASISKTLEELAVIYK